jgi:hypothetical protein
MEVIVTPFTETLPLAMISSAALLEAIPACERKT